MKKLSRKGIVIGIIILFIGASFIPIINGDIGKYTTLDPAIKEEIQYFVLENDLEYNSCFLNNGPVEEWNKTYGGMYDDWGVYGQHLDDGFIIVGNTYSFGVGDRDILLIKTDTFGVELWNRTFGNKNNDEETFCIQQISDGGFIIVGMTDSYDSSHVDGWLIKTDNDGIEQWNKTFSIGDVNVLSHVEETTDGGFVMTGLTQFNNPFEMDIWVVKTNNEGDVEWSKSYVDEEYEYGYRIQQTVDNGYIISGSVSGTEQTNARRNAILLKLDNNGNQQWIKEFGGDLSVSGGTVVQTDDGGYLLSTLYNPLGEGHCDFGFIKTDDKGNEKWTRRYGDRYCNEGVAFLQLTNDGGFIASGDIEKDSLKNDYDCIIVKFDRNGYAEWSKTIGGPGFDNGMKVDELTEGGYTIYGSTNSYDGTDNDAWLIKIAEFSNNRPDKPSKLTGNIKIRKGEEYQYYCVTNDTDSDHIFYLFDWGDGSDSGWLGPYDSGENCEAVHVWTEKGTYEIKVKARDIHGGESEWSDPLAVSMPKNKVMNSFFIRFSENYLIKLPLLRILFKLDEGVGQ